MTVSIGCRASALLISASALLAACGAGSSGDVQTDDINETAYFDAVGFFCDGDAAITDWLVVADAETTVDVIDVEVLFFQSGSSFGPIELSEVRPGQWYGDMWEDDLGLDCDGATIDATFTAIADNGDIESLDL